MDTGSNPPERPAGREPEWLPPQAPGAEPPPVAPRPEAPVPEAPVPYGGPVPPGGWQQPPAAAKADAWVGKPLASWWSRVAASVLDGLILFVALAILVGILVAVAVSGGGAVEIVAWSLAVVVYLAGIAFYAPVLMARDGARNGQTWGKQIVGIRVVRDKGGEVDFGFAFVREALIKWLLFGVIGGFFFIPPILDWLWPLWDDENRALHDMLASSHVVRA